MNQNDKVVGRNFFRNRESSCWWPRWILYHFKRMFPYEHWTRDINLVRRSHHF